MKLEIFQNRIKKFEDLLLDEGKYEVIWIEPQWFHIEPKNDKHSTLSIRYEFEEVSVGIDHVKEYYSDKYEEGRKYEDGYNRFMELLTSRIKRQVKYKGNFSYRVDYLVEKNGEFKKFASFLTWLYPYWRKTKVVVSIQNPILKK